LSEITTPGARDLVERKGYKSADELAVAYYSADKHISSTRRLSGNAVDLPDAAKATDEDWRRFYSALGRPETPDKYQFKLDGVEADNGFLTAARGMMHEAGLSQRQAETLIGKYMAYAQQRGAAETSSAIGRNETELHVLKTTWGTSFEGNVLDGRKAVAALGLDARLVDRLQGEHGLVGTMDLLARIGRAVNAGKVQFNDATTAEAKIAEMKGNKAFQDSLRDRRHPKHAENLKAWEAAFAAAYPPKRTL
jgi:hypothetical protein